MEQIKIENLSVSYDKEFIIENLNVTIPKGKITIIIGANGCGKSTLLKSIARVIKPKKGSIYIAGKDIKTEPAKEIAKRVTFLPQSPVAPEGLLVKELVAYGRYPYQKALGGLQQHDIDTIQWAIKETSLQGYEDDAIMNLSGGQRQRAWIAMALAQETETLLLDEPTTYLDIAHQLEILTLLQTLNKEEQRTIVLVLHELNNASRFADHMIGMKDGKIVFEGKPMEVITQENLSTIYGISSQIQLDKTNQYPICVEYHFHK